ncbi:MAG: rRNA maturation RNAse YbeY [Parcubacteria group bacterium]|nr:rRNA maturation RNAse YbeY [Parcubacteria group bacterium]
MLVHGLLHLFGYNHQEKNDRIRMEKAEQKLLLKIRSTKHEIRNNI